MDVHNKPISEKFKSGRR
ncbi:unnamed protein product [Cuscuta epithymum]|uniref:Uncharacterized protein n=1 Tax=Cuscuta epithymum TaxID=186058 RepID=A0AAV0EF69_9ASTE|nr:unnamed protein product [Cuscuta epithymum]CAH9122839.1 unnamed protein product [Cuscuta epithymum]